MPISGKEPGPPDGHLGTAWEVAVVSAFVVVIIAVVIVVAFQIRRKKRRQRELDLESATRPARRKSKRPGSGIEVADFKKGQVEVSTSKTNDVEEEIVSETETESTDNDTKPKRMSRSSRHSSSSRTKPKSSRPSRTKKPRPKKPSTTPGSSTVSPSQDDYYFEHPSQKPPKYYWQP